MIAAGLKGVRTVLLPAIGLLLMAGCGGVRIETGATPEEREIAASTRAREVRSSFATRFDRLDERGRADMLWTHIDSSAARIVSMGRYFASEWRKGNAGRGAAIPAEEMRRVFDNTIVQSIKFPRDVIRDKSGTCIELAALYCSMAHSVGLKPYMVLIPGHAFSLIRLPSGNLLPVETTGVGGGLRHGSAPFDKVVTAAAETYKKAAAEGRQIPEGWALDADGNPTTDPHEGLKGSMVPSGGYKGFGAGLMTEIFAACLSGAVLGKDSTPFAGPVGGPCNTGQCFIAFDPDVLSGGGFGMRVDDLCGAILAQQGTRLPGSKRAGNRSRIEAEGTLVDEALVERIRAI